MRKGILLLLFLGALSAQAGQIKITTFNLKWFGLGGNPAGGRSDEYRENWIYQFSGSDQGGDFLRSDILIFQEVVDMQRLQQLVGLYRCTSYDSTQPLHQHVVICLRPGLKLMLDGGDDNFTLENVAGDTSTSTGGLRPAVHGLVTSNDGQGILHILGVHLKAMPDGTSTRLKQIQYIEGFLRTLTDDLPKVVAGDFNSYVETGELTAFDRILTTVKRIPFSLMTFRSPQSNRQFDHFFVSPSVAGGTPLVPAVCQPGYSRRDRFHDPEFYGRMVSDHCPVTITITL